MWARVPAPPGNCPDRVLLQDPENPASIEPRSKLRRAKRKLLGSPAWCDFAPRSAPTFSFCFLIKERKARVCAPREDHSSLQLLEGLRTSGFQMGSQEMDRRICFTRVVRRPSSPSAGDLQTSLRRGRGLEGEEWDSGQDVESSCRVPKVRLPESHNFTVTKRAAGTTTTKRTAPRPLSSPLSGIQDASGI